MLIEGSEKMLLTKLTYEGERQFIEKIQNIPNKLKEKDVKLGISESIEGKTHFIKIFCNDECYDKKIKSIVNLYISKILYEIIIDMFNKKELFEYLTDSYFFLKQEEMLEVEEKIMNILYGREKINDETNIYCINRINEITEKIKECVEENENINIDGFLRFRSKDIATDIEKIIDKVIEQYMVEKEYKEFIDLLKYFVDIQESKIEEVNIIIEDEGQYKITDKLGNNIFYKFISELSECNMGKGINVEDIIISGLITNSPENIIIHHCDRCLNKEFIDTIKNVFGERVRYCEKCSICTIPKIKL